MHSPAAPSRGRRQGDPRGRRRAVYERAVDEDIDVVEPVPEYGDADGDRNADLSDRAEDLDRLPWHDRAKWTECDDRYRRVGQPLQLLPLDTHRAPETLDE